MLTSKIHSSNFLSFSVIKPLLQEEISSKELLVLKVRYFLFIVAFQIGTFPIIRYLQALSQRNRTNLLINFL